MEAFFRVIDAVNGVMLSVPVLLALLGTGLLFTLWSGFSQYRSLTHGMRLLRGQVPGVSGAGRGALSHFQALSAALSGTVGLGNIAGVAIAVEFGGPGAVFWMWMVGLAGMALKTVEVTLAVKYRDDSDPDNPHGGAMYVCRHALAARGGLWKSVAGFAGAFFTLAVILFAVTGGNMFQAWSVADTTHSYFGIPQWLSGLVLATLTGAVLLGGIRRIGAVAGRLVPVMCGVYVLCGLYVLAHNVDQLPDMFRLILASAFAPAEAGGAFTGATLGMAFIFGMKRALFSSEAGLGTAPMAHSAVRTAEPASEGVVAGLEPFIDTLVVCTITALVILSSGVWNRGAAVEAPVRFEMQAPGQWQPVVETGGQLAPGQQVFVVVQHPDGTRERVYGDVAADGVRWAKLASPGAPVAAEPGVFVNYRGSTLAARAFDSVQPGLGQWMVTLTVWLFALSTVITYGYYAEQGLSYFGGERWVPLGRWLWVAVIFVTCLGFIDTAEQIDALSTVALGFMLAVNLPLMWLLGRNAMITYRGYFTRHG